METPRATQTCDGCGLKVYSLTDEGLCRFCDEGWEEEPEEEEKEDYE